MNIRLGIDLGGTAIKLGILDEQYRIIAQDSVPTPKEFEHAADAMAEAAKNLLARAGQQLTSLPFVGIGVPSSVHPLTGRLMEANNKNWHDAPLKEAMQARLGLPVLVANDADCALSGEATVGAAVGVKNVLMLTLGTGVGGALLMDGHLYRGADGMGMELGHIPLVSGGRPCTCGAEGCLETYASATGLITMTKEIIREVPDTLMAQYVEAHGGKITGETAFKCAKTGDGAAMRIINDFCNLLSQGIGGLTNIFRPQLVIIGGGVSHAGDDLLKPLQQIVPHFILSYGLIGGPVIRLAKLGNDAGVIGAAFLDRVQHRQPENT